MTEKETFVYQLSEKLKYTPEGAGEFSETASIEFSGPSMEVRDDATVLSQLVACAILSHADKARANDNEAGADKIPSTSEVKVMLMASKDIKFKDVEEAFIGLACKVGKLDNKTYMKKDLFNSMSLEDFHGMVCGYIANFIFPSIFSENEDGASG